MLHMLAGLSENDLGWTGWHPLWYSLAKGPFTPDNLAILGTTEAQLWMPVHSRTFPELQICEWYECTSGGLGGHSLLANGPRYWQPILRCLRHQCGKYLQLFHQLLSAFWAWIDSVHPGIDNFVLCDGFPTGRNFNLSIKNFFFSIKLEMLGCIVSHLASPRKIWDEKKFGVKFFLSTLDGMKHPEMHKKVKVRNFFGGEKQILDENKFWVKKKIWKKKNSKKTKVA